MKKILRFILIQLRDIAVTFLISFVITYLFVGDKLFSNFSSFISNCMYGFTIAFTLWKGNFFLAKTLGRKFPWEKKPTLSLLVNIIGSVLYNSITIVIVNYLLYEFVYEIPVKTRLRQLFIQMIVQFGISMFITTSFYLRHFFLSWRKSFINEEAVKKEAIALQYETLKSYVNPHFLFNSLSVLSSLVERDTVKSQKFIKQLSDIYRYVLEQKDKELVELSTELAFAQSFIELHKIRHGESLKVDVKVDDLSGYIMPLSMQILLENAFKHNIISEEEPLDIKVWRENEYIVVQNKRQERKTLNQTGGIGLETIKRRYEIISKKPFFIDSENGFFTVHLPIIVDDRLLL